MAAVMKTATATGSVASFWSPKVAAIKSLKVYFEPKQAGEGDPSPDNVRPIEGWTGVEVTHCMARDTSEPQTYTSSWESEVGTVYGGYVDLISGELTVTKSKYTFTGSEADGITYYGQITDSSGVDRNIFRTNIFDRYFENNSTRYLSSNIALPHLTENRQRKPEIMIYIGTPTNQVQFYPKTSLCEPTVESFCSFLNEHNIDLVGLLANPVTHQLTPQQLSSFIGRNNLFSNANNIEVEYEYADSPELEVIKKRIALNEPHLGNASGSVASFYTDMASPMKSLKVNFEAKQSGTGDPSPDNVRPIAGVDQINVYRTGKNLCHIVGYSAKTHSTLLANRATQNDYGTSISTINYTSPDTPLVVTQSSYDESKVPNHYNNGFFVLMLDSLVFGQTYNVSFRITDILSNPLNVSPSIINIGTPSGYEQQPTEVQGDKIIYKNVKYDKNKSHDTQYFFVRCCGMSYTMSEFMVTEATEEDQTFEPYEGDIIPCSFSELGTQYGGYVDLAKGMLTATHYHLDINTTSIPSTKIDGIYNNYIVIRFGVTENNLPQFVENTQISNRFSKSLPSGTPGRIAMTSKYIYMVIPKDDLTGSDIAAIREWFANNPTEVVYELKTPITYQLTSQQIKTFRGTNNIYSFDGTVDVKYWLHSDVKTERKTAQI